MAKQSTITNCDIRAPLTDWRRDFSNKLLHSLWPILTTYTYHCNTLDRAIQFDGNQKHRARKCDANNSTLVAIVDAVTGNWGFIIVAIQWWMSLCVTSFYWVALITCSFVHYARLFPYSVCFIQTRGAHQSSSTYNIEQLKGKLYTNITTKVIFR